MKNKDDIGIAAGLMIKVLLPFRSSTEILFYLLVIGNATSFCLIALITEISLYLIIIITETSFYLFAISAETSF